MFSKKCHPCVGRTMTNEVNLEAAEKIGRALKICCQVWGSFKWHLISGIQVVTILLRHSGSNKTVLRFLAFVN